MLEKFDKDGDGELSDDEKAEMKKAMKNRPGARAAPAVATSKSAALKAVNKRLESH